MSGSLNRGGVTIFILEKGTYSSMEMIQTFSVGSIVEYFITALLWEYITVQLDLGGMNSEALGRQFAYIISKVSGWKARILRILGSYNGMCDLWIVLYWISPLLRIWIMLRNPESVEIGWRLWSLKAKIISLNLHYQIIWMKYKLEIVKNVHVQIEIQI